MTTESEHHAPQGESPSPSQVTHTPLHKVHKSSGYASLYSVYLSGHTFHTPSGDTFYTPTGHTFHTPSGHTFHTPLGHTLTALSNPTWMVSIMLLATVEICTRNTQFQCNSTNDEFTNHHIRGNNEFRYYSNDSTGHWSHADKPAWSLRYIIWN